MNTTAWSLIFGPRMQAGLLRRNDTEEFMASKANLGCWWRVVAHAPLATDSGSAGSGAAGPGEAVPTGLAVAAPPAAPETQPVLRATQRMIVHIVVAGLAELMYIAPTDAAHPPFL